MTGLWIENRLEEFTPYNFLQWILNRYLIDDAELPELEGCIEQFFRDKGVEGNIHVFLDEQDGFIILKSGVQSVKDRPPEWVHRFIDSVGWSEEHLNERYTVVIGLVRIIMDMAYQTGKETERNVWEVMV